MITLHVNEIKLGILSNIKRQIVIGTSARPIRISKKLRGIIYTERSENIGSDVNYPILQYPMINQNPVSKSTIGIIKSVSLAPLLYYFGLVEITFDQLQKFISEILLNKKWLNDNQELLSSNMWATIHEIQNLGGFELSKKEQKKYKIN